MCNSYAQTTTDTTQLWTKTTILNKIGPNGNFESFLMDRMINSNGRSMSPARVVFYQIPLSDRNPETSSNQAIWNVLSRGLELSDVNTTDRANVTIMSGVWTTAHRIIQVVITRDDKYLRYSIANYRQSYHELLGEEILTVQTNLVYSPSKLNTVLSQFINFNLYATDTEANRSNDQLVIPSYVQSGLGNLFSANNSGRVLSFAASAVGLSFLSDIASTAVEALFSIFDDSNRVLEEQEIISKLLESKAIYEKSTETLRTLERGLDEIYSQSTSNPDWLSNRSYPEILQNISTIRVNLSEDANAKKQVLREEKMKQVRGQEIDCIDCLERLPGEIARLELQLDQINTIQDRLRSSTSICELMKHDLDKIMEIETNLYNLYNGIFSEHSLDDLRSAISSNAIRNIDRSSKAHSNTIETPAECINRIERVFAPILEDRIERENLSWQIDDMSERCHLSWCLIGDIRHQELEQLSRRDRRQEAQQCEREGMWDLFRGHTPQSRYTKCQRLVGVMDTERTARVHEITQQYNQEKTERTRFCNRTIGHNGNSSISTDTVILSEVSRNLEFIDSVIRNQEEIQNRINAYQLKKRRLAEICPDI